jgi:peptidoglycan/LPS O-acetylase OafA/YrhL
MRNNNFNLIRFILASFVIFCHNIELLEGNTKNEILYLLFKSPMHIGILSVNLFFLVSGYLIVKSWDKNNNAWTFISNRILRIYPGFIAASIISCFLLAPFAGDVNYFNQFNYRKFFTGLLLLKDPTTPPIFTGSFYPFINVPLWTINNEFFCYIIVLLLGLISLIKNKIGWLIFFITFFIIKIIGGVFNIEIIRNFFSNIILAEFFEIHWFFSFFIGGTYYLFGRPYLNRKPIILLTAIITLINFYYNGMIGYALPLFGGYLLLSFAERTIPFLSNFNKLPDISYGIYLYGWPISKFLIFYQPKISYWLLNVESFFIAILFGLFSWYLIEKPSININKKNKFEKRSSEITLSLT